MCQSQPPRLKSTSRFFSLLQNWQGSRWEMAEGHRHLWEINVEPIKGESSHEVVTLHFSPLFFELFTPPQFEFRKSRGFFF